MRRPTDKTPRGRATSDRLLADIRGLAAEMVHIKKQMRATGLFCDDRELLECPACGLQEDVTFEGVLITYNRRSRAHRDTGLRFKELSDDRFRCPACRAIVREPLPAVEGVS